MSRSAIIAIASSLAGTQVAGLDAEGHVIVPPVDVARNAPPRAALLGEVLQQAARQVDAVDGVAIACSDPEILGMLGREAARVPGPVSTVGFAHAALEGERLQGAAAGRRSVLLLDTDALEVGLLLNGSVYRGGFGRAGSVAHLGLDRTGTLRCTCGRTGCLSAVMAADETAPMPPLPRDSRPMPSRRLGWLAVALVTLLNTINPEVLILAGSFVAHSADFEWLGDTARLGCLAPTRAGLAEVTRARPERALVGAAALLSGVLPDPLANGR